MITFNEALDLVFTQSRPLASERIALETAFNRVLARPVRARIDSPRADASSMDGYAVRAAEVVSGNARLRVVGQAAPGMPFEGTVDNGACVRIFTGGPLPSGTDSIVIQEKVTRVGDLAHVTGPVQVGSWVRRFGSDFRCGDVLLAGGRQLGARDLVAAAAGDVAHVEVVRQPRVALISTGSELVAVGEAASRPFGIPDSLSGGLAALSAEHGAVVVDKRRLGDDLRLLQATAAELLPRIDVAVVTGGASVGEHDHAKAIFEGGDYELIFSRVAMKPGKPVWFGRRGDCLIVGLPGNPTSALVTARLLLAPLLAGLSGRDGRKALTWATMTAASPMPREENREAFWRAALVDGAVLPLPNQNSAAQGALANADLLVRRRAGAGPVAPGDPVEVTRF